MKTFRLNSIPRCVDAEEKEREREKEEDAGEDVAEEGERKTRPSRRPV